MTLKNQSRAAAAADLPDCARCDDPTPAALDSPLDGEPVCDACYEDEDGGFICCQCESIYFYGDGREEEDYDLTLCLDCAEHYPPVSDILDDCDWMQALARAIARQNPRRIGELNDLQYEWAQSQEEREAKDAVCAALLDTVLKR